MNVFDLIEMERVADSKEPVFIVTTRNQLVKRFHRICYDIWEDHEEIGESSSYARQYAYEGVKMLNGERIRTQIGFLLRSLETWHGEVAKAVKAELTYILDSL